MGFLYFLVVHATGHFYVGSSTQLKKRVEFHLSDLKCHRHHNTRLQELWNKYPNLEISYVTFDSIEQARAAEQTVIDNNRDDQKMLNIGSSVVGGDNLTYNPNREEIIKRMTETLRSRFAELTPKERRIIYGKRGSKNGMYGKTHTEEVRRYLSKINTGRPSPVKGTKLSAERRAQISKFAKTRTGEKNPFYGKSHSEETRKRLSEFRMGKENPCAHVPIEIDGIKYKSQSEASRTLGIPAPTICWRLKSPKFPNYINLNAQRPSNAPPGNV